MAKMTLVHSFKKNEHVIETTLYGKRLLIVTNKAVYYMNLDEKRTALRVVKP